MQVKVTFGLNSYVIVHLADLSSVTNSTVHSIWKQCNNSKQLELSWRPVLSTLNSYVRVLLQATRKSCGKRTYMQLMWTQFAVVSLRHKVYIIIDSTSLLCSSTGQGWTGEKPPDRPIQIVVNECRTLHKPWTSSNYLHLNAWLLGLECLLGDSELTWTAPAATV